MTEQNKRKFKTVEPDVDELNRKIREHRLKIIKRMAVVTAIVLLLTAATMLMLKLHQYTDYEVITSEELTETLAANFVEFDGGIIKYSNDGAIYINSLGELIWNQAYEMQEPLIAICEGYVAFAEKGGMKIYILNAEGLQGSLETTMGISRIQVANQGTVAVLMEKEGKSHIQLYDRDGNKLAGGQIRVENTGYPLDIALSNDGIKMAVTMLDVNEGDIKSLIAFYNFGSVGQNEIDKLVGTYSYSELVIPEIAFVSNNTMLAFGDSRVIVFEGTQKPKPSKEIALEKELRSIFYNNNYFGLVTNNEDEQNTRHMEVYDSKGGHILTKDFALDYTNIEFLANNEISIYNEKECLIYNTYGVQHFAHLFDTPLYKILAGNTSRDYTFILEGTTEKVKLK